jgi:hypothetical protein
MQGLKNPVVIAIAFTFLLNNISVQGESTARELTYVQVGKETGRLISVLLVSAGIGFFTPVSCASCSSYHTDQERSDPTWLADHRPYNLPSKERHSTTTAHGPALHRRGCHYRHRESRRYSLYTGGNYQLHAGCFWECIYLTCLAPPASSPTSR